MGKYWIAYYISFLVGVVVLTGTHWYSPRWNEDWLALSSDIFGVAFGISLTLALLVEVVGNMVLLIPQRIKELKDRGRREQQKRVEEAYRRFGVEVNGVRMLPQTPEVRRFLRGEEDYDSAEE